MGLSASQARMLTLFARKSDNEQQGQQVNNKRALLANLTAEASRVYADKVGNRSFKYRAIAEGNSSQYYDLGGAQLNNMYADGNGKTYSFTVNGQAVTRDQVKAMDPTTIYDILKGEQLQVTETAGGTSNVFTVDSTNYDEGLYTGDDAAATAQYQSKTADLQAQDKRLEIELKNIDTQHQTIQTEIDAVKKVIDKNIEMTFKTFG